MYYDRKSTKSKTVELKIQFRGSATYYDVMDDLRHQD